MLSAEQNKLLTETDPNTSCGDLLRRYWQPAALTEELVGSRPAIAVRLMGEDLVLFKDERGRFLTRTASPTSLPLLGHHPRYLSVALTLRARGLVNVGQKLRLKISTRARRYRGEKPTLKVKRRGRKMNFVVP